MRLPVLAISLVLLTGGCDQIQQAQEPATFEVRDFTTKEETTDATGYSKKWNEFKSTGTLVAKNVPTDRAVIVILEVKDISDTPNPEPRYTSVLVRSGTGKIELEKSDYGEMSKRPNYQWNVLGWHVLQNGTVKSVN